MKQVTDLLDVQVSMDDEDRELMRMFPRSRQTVINDMLMVQDRNGMYLVRKEDISLWKKAVRSIVTAVWVVLCTLLLLASITAFAGGYGYPALYLTTFEMMLLPLLVKIPAEVKGTEGLSQ